MFASDDEIEDRDDYDTEPEPGDMDALIDWTSIRFGIESGDELRERLALGELTTREACAIALRLYDLADQYVPGGDE